MQDADLFMELAGIAGVFVGFGALIAVRSGGASGMYEVTATRGIVSLGVLAIIAALAPVTLGRYDLSEHGVWAVSSLLILVGLFGVFALGARTPEYQEGLAAFRKDLRWSTVVRAAPANGLATTAVLLPIAIMLGLAPELEAALYFTVVVMVLLGAAWFLLALVFAQRSPDGALLWHHDARAS